MRILATLKTLKLDNRSIVRYPEAGQVQQLDAKGQSRHDKD